MLKKIILTVIILILFTTGGCWSRREPKELAIVTSSIYETGDQERYKLTFEILDPASFSGQSGETNMRKFKIIIMEGNSHSEATRNASLHIGRRVYGGNNKARFFTEKLINNYLMETFDFLMRDHIADERPIMVMIKGDIDTKMLYECDMGLSEQLGIYTENMIRNRYESIAYTSQITSLDFMKAYYSDGIQPVMCAVEIVENKAKLPSDEEKPPTVSKYSLNFDGLAVFKNDKVVGYLNDKETRAFNIIQNQVKRTYMEFRYGSDLKTATNQNAKTDISIDYKNDKVTIKIDTKATLRLVQVQNKATDVTDYKEIKRVEESLSEEIKKEVTDTIKRVQTEYKSDIFGFGQVFHRQYPAEWRKIKDKWDDEYFANAEIIMNVESKIIGEGEIREPFGWRFR
jgi:spore germination protein KC